MKPTNGHLACPPSSNLPICLEITRLQNSLQHLKHTQDELHAHSDDPELAQALRENEAVMSVHASIYPSFIIYRHLFHSDGVLRMQRISGRAD